MNYCDKLEDNAENNEDYGDLACEVSESLLKTVMIIDTLK